MPKKKLQEPIYKEKLKGGSMRQNEQKCYAGDCNILSDKTDPPELNDIREHYII